jgi:hypothetical protein
MRCSTLTLILLLMTFIASMSTAADAVPGCRATSGGLTRTPTSESMYTYRLRTTDGEYISIEQIKGGDGSLLETLKVLFGRGDGPVRGTYTICLTGIAAYDYVGKPIHRARITAFTPEAAK